jgi:hypothetical protein
MSVKTEDQQPNKRKRPNSELYWRNELERTLPGFLGPPFRVTPPSNADHDDWDLYVPEEYPPSIPDIGKMQQLWESMMSSVDASRRAIDQAEEVYDANKRAASALGLCLRSLGIPIPQQGHGLMERFPPFVDPFPPPSSPLRPPLRPLELKREK